MALFRPFLTVFRTHFLIMGTPFTKVNSLPRNEIFIYESGSLFFTFLNISFITSILKMLNNLLLETSMSIPKNLELSFSEKEENKVLRCKGPWGDTSVNIPSSLSLELSEDLTSLIRKQIKPISSKKSTNKDDLEEINPFNKKATLKNEDFDAQYNLFLKGLKDLIKTTSRGKHYGLKISGVGWRSFIRKGAEVPGGGMVSIPVEKPGKPRITPKLPLGLVDDLESSFLELKLGKSHYDHVQIPDLWNVKVDPAKGQSIIISGGATSSQVGDYVAKVRSNRVPEVYKGKGVQILGESLILKEGKKSSG